MRTLTQPEEHTDTEITLGMTSLLGIFFGLVLICGVFFGLGYSLGRHPAPEGATASPSITPADDSSAASAARAKPSAQQALQAADSSLPAMPAESSSSPADDTTAATTTPRTPAPAADDTQAAPRARPAAQLKAAVVNPATPALQTSVRPAPPVPTPATLSTAVATPTMVQIAAVSRQEDADVLVSALKTHGFNVMVRNESQDKLLHIQVGPFPNREQARAMRQKLLDAGYNAILKP